MRRGGYVPMQFRDVQSNKGPVFPRVFNKAVRIGIDYVGTANQLSGCRQDLVNLKEKFNQCGISFASEIVITDDTPTKPTKANIMAALNWLIAAAKPGDHLFFQISSHGSYQKSTNDPYEQNDQLVVPLDMDISGPILDNDLNALLATVPAGVNIIMLFDCCHSCTMIDAAYELIVQPQTVTETYTTQVPPQQVVVQQPQQVLVQQPQAQVPQPEFFHAKPFTTHCHKKHHSGCKHGGSKHRRHVHRNLHGYEDEYSDDLVFDETGRAWQWNDRHRQWVHQRNVVIRPDGRAWKWNGFNWSPKQFFDAASSFLSNAQSAVSYGQQVLQQVQPFFGRSVVLTAPQQQQQTVYRTVLQSVARATNRPNNIKASVLCISGCLDTGTSAEGTDPNGRSCGAMTNALLSRLALMKATPTSLSTLITGLRSDLQAYGQSPQISASFPLSNEMVLEFQ